MVCQKDKDDSKRRINSVKMINNKVLGSLTLEAAIAFPVFIFAVINLLSTLEVIRASCDIESCLHKIGKEVALYAVAEDMVNDYVGLNGITSEVCATMLADGYSASRMSQDYSSDYGHSVEVIPSGITPVNFALSKAVVDESIVDISILYQVEPLCNIFNIRGYLLSNRCYMHMWTGYDGKGVSGIGSSDQIVFVTENGTVYHLTTSCSYLDLSISGVAVSNLDEQRNMNGGIYTACDICNPSVTDSSTSLLFVTDYGDKYHNSLSCSGLKRTINEMSKTEAEEKGLGACSKCGGGE